MASSSSWKLSSETSFSFSSLSRSSIYIPYLYGRRKNCSVRSCLEDSRLTSSSSSGNARSLSYLKDSKSDPFALDSKREKHPIQIELVWFKEKEGSVWGRNVDQKLKWLGKKPLWKRIFFASKKMRSIILLNVITVIYASSIPVVKEIEEIMDPALFTVVRFSVSAIPFIPFMVRAGSDGPTRAAGIELGFWVSLGYLTQAIGLLTSDACRASFISALTVVVVPLIDGMLGAKVPLLTWIGALISVIGIIALESGGSPPCVGDILNILSAVFFGIHMLRTERISRNTKKEKFLALLGYEILVIAVFSAIWYILGLRYHDVGQLLSPSWTTVWDGVISFPWIPALYTGIISTGLCLWAEMGAMCNVSATETAIIYGLEPVWGAAFSWFLLGERWEISEWFGAALVIGGSLTVQIMGSSSENPSKKEEKHVKRDILNVHDRERDLSHAVVVINSRKNVKSLSDRSVYKGR